MTQKQQINIIPYIYIMYIYIYLKKPRHGVEINIFEAAVFHLWGEPPVRLQSPQWEAGTSQTFGIGAERGASEDGADALRNLGWVLHPP